ncbi:MAG: zinc ABC transporter substrate-binding protein [Candidatus Thorarchaeota archaeon]|nr:zinc ABC transporter substrate-binding protein [Candidatus Thorarchaeota archaeon]
MNPKGTALLLIVLLVYVGAALSICPVRGQIQQVKVAVAIAPLEGLVRSVGGVLVNTTILLPEGVEPHAATLPPEAVMAADSADLLVLTGHFPWEENLVSVVDTPFITLDDADALFTYEDHGARLSPMPGHQENATTTADEHHHDEGNPHGYWLLPSNALAIANTTLSALEVISPAHNSTWEVGFSYFQNEVEAYLSLVAEADTQYDLSGRKAVAVFPAEAYVAETFGIVTVAVLQVENVLISGVELLEVQESMRNGSVSLIIGSDVASLQTGGEYAVQLAEDYGATLVWVRAVFFEGLSDYISVMTYNLGAIVSGIAQARGNLSSTVNVALVALAGVLGLVAVLEAVVMVRRAKSE